MVAGEVTPGTSPCGVNCTYSLNFDGPAFECTDHAINQSTVPYNNNSGSQIVYTGIWTNIGGLQDLDLSDT